MTPWVGSPGRNFAKNVFDLERLNQKRLLKMTDKTIRVRLIPETNFIAVDSARSNGVVISVPKRSAFNKFTFALLVVIVVLVGFAGRVPQALSGPTSDSALFILMGRSAATTGIMGVDLVDVKFHSVGMLMSLPWRALGAWWPGYGLLGIVMSLASCALLARAASNSSAQHLATRSTFWPTFVLAAITLNYAALVGGLFQLETTLVFASSAAAFFTFHLLKTARPSTALVIGLVCGTAALVKPSAFGVFAASGVVFLFTPVSPLRKIICVVAAIVGLVPAILTFALYPTITETWTQVSWTFNQISLYAKQSYRDWALLSRPLIVVVILLAPALFALLLRSSACRLSKTCVTFTLLWLAIESIGVIAQGRMYAYHFLVLAPPAALLFGLLSRSLSTRQIVRVLALPMVISLTLTAWTFQVLQGGEDSYTRSRDAAASIVHETGGTVWSEDWSRLVLEEDLPMPGRVPHLFLFTCHDEAPVMFGKMLISDLLSRPPAVMILPRDIDKHVAFMRANNAEFARFSKRGDGLARVWNQIRLLRDANYKLVNVFGSLSVYRRDLRVPARGQLAAEDQARAKRLD